MKYNVVAEYDWTSSPRGSGMRTKAPRVWVKSYKLKSNQIMQAIKGFVAIATEGGGSGNAKSFYEKMYGEAAEAEDDFNFPFFGDEVRSFGNNFGDTFQDGIGGSGGIGGDIFQAAKGFAGGVGQALNLSDSSSLESAKGSLANAAGSAASGNFKEAGKSVMSALNTLGNGGAPGTYIESPMFYQFEKSDSPLNVSFALANTINADSVSKNKALIDKLTRINRPLRTNSIAVDPPRIYQVKVPGHRFIKWAYCEQFSVKLLGTRREINGVIVPEAYEISMSFKSLTLEHSGFMDSV
jgi:hypothetical protein